MSTISGLMLRQPEFQPFDLGRTLTQATNIQGGQLANQTSLLQLEELRRAQEEAALARQFMAANAGQMVPGGGAGPLLASPALTAPGGGPMTQQTVVPGQPPGAPQPVPGGQDLSRYAGVSPQGGGPIPPDVAAQVMPTVTPQGGPQPTLGQLQPQQDPFEARLQALMAQSPGAALQVMQTRMKMQEQQLTWGLKSIEAVAQLTHGVKNQEDLDRVRAQMQQIAPQAAAQLPQFYSAEALEAFQEKALSVKERQTLKIADLQAQTDVVKAQADVLKARMSGRVATTDEYLKVLGVTPGQETPEDMRRALELKTQDLARIQAANVTPQVVQGEGGYVTVNPRTLETRPVPAGGQAAAGTGQPGAQAEQLRPPMTADDKKIADYADRMAQGQAKLKPLEDSGDYTSWKAPIANMPGGRIALTEKQQSYETAKSEFLQGLLRRDSQGQISAQEWADYSRTYFPQPGEGPEIVKQKQAMREGVIRAQQAILGRPGVSQQAPSGGQTSQAPSGGQPSAAPTAQGPATFDTADFAQWRRSTGKTGNPTAADVEAYFAAKGLKRR